MSIFEFFSIVEISPFTMGINEFLRFITWYISNEFSKIFPLNGRDAFEMLKMPSEESILLERRCCISSVESLELIAILLAG